MSGGGRSSTHFIDRPLPRGKTEVNLSAFSFLFSEIVSSSQSRTSTLDALEDRFVLLFLCLPSRSLHACCFLMLCPQTLRDRLVGGLSRPRPHRVQGKAGQARDQGRPHPHHDPGLISPRGSHPVSTKCSSDPRRTLLHDATSGRRRSGRPCLAKQPTLLKGASKASTSASPSSFPSSLFLSPSLGLCCDPHAHFVSLAFLDRHDH